MSQRLKDKVILVTGSTTGIGEGMVRVFAREGAKVIVAAPQIHLTHAKSSRCACPK